jgi:putative tricarboxylic transport membrane protein
MTVRVNAPKDLLAGLIFIAFGLVTFVLAHDYEIGTAVAMGPGYFPAAIGLVLAAIGVAAIARGISRKSPDPITPHRIEPLLRVFAGILAFSFLIEPAGLLVASAALIGIACFRRLLSNPLEVLIIYVALTGFSALVFVRWFDMQLPLF